jgi:hypothetical protein
VLASWTWAHIQGVWHEHLGQRDGRACPQHAQTLWPLGGTGLSTLLWDRRESGGGRRAAASSHVTPAWLVSSDPPLAAPPLGFLTRPCPEALQLGLAGTAPSVAARSLVQKEEQTRRLIALWRQG